MLFDVFVDQALRARQDQLNSAWQSLNDLKTGCDGLPDSAWHEFVTDLKAWNDFYDSGSDWSADSKHATDEWQQKAQSWQTRMAQYGCRGSLGIVTTTDQFGNPIGRTNVVTDGGDQGIPGVKDPPPDQKGIVDDVENAIRTVGWVAAGLLLVIVVGIFYVASRPSLHAAAGRAAGSV